MPVPSSRRLVAGCVLALSLVVVLGGATAASAQIVYEPVQSQYQYHGKTYYYGGSDPRVVEHVRRDIDRTSYTSAVTQEPVVHRQRVYSDYVPYENLADHSYTTYGSYTSADVQNEANANAARYFRKRDLLRSAVVMPDGSWTVPADAQPRVTVPTVRPDDVMAPTTRGTILIIPRKLLEQPKKDPTSVAIAK